ncbi:MAG: hypothetical protein ABSB86_12950 [Bryobacteraceae bacterium]
MRDNFLYAVGVVGNREIEAPVFVDAGLPEIVGLVVLFRVQGGVEQIIREEAKLLLKGPLYIARCILQRINRPVGEDNRLVVLILSVFRFRISWRRNLIAASAVSKGP